MTRRWRPTPVTRRVYVRRVFVSMVAGWQTLRIGDLWARAFGADEQAPGVLDLVQR
jgi:hypothetical protein